MFFAPYGCSWAKHSICKSLLVQSQILYFWRKSIHLLLGTSRQYQISHSIKIKGGAVSHTFFHPEAGKPVSSLNTSPQVSGNGRMLHGYPVLSFYPTFQFQCFHFNACGDTKTIFSVGACEKNLCQPPSRHVPHFGNPITAGQDMLRGPSIRFAYSPH